ncbi:MAG: hypothetical protein KAW19_11875 [Candidatus Aminicenantes bacterium]|nr:hypothetical protein [Candidatus Aminicenantes bacterium]
MDFQEKVKRLQEELRKAISEKNVLERQIAFRKEWISKLELRLQKAKQGDNDGYVWHSTFGEDLDAKLWKLTSELKSENEILTSIQKEYSELENRVRFFEEKLKKEQSSEFDFGWRKKDVHEGRDETKALSASELEALRIIAETKKGSVVTRISRFLNVGYDYARLLWLSLGRYDYIDIKPDGKTELTDKGEKALEKKGLAPWL